MAVMMRGFSGSSEPGAFTDRIISPTRTESIHGASTSGAAGCSRLMKAVMTPTPTTAAAMTTIRLVFLGGSRLISTVLPEAPAWVEKRGGQRAYQGSIVPVETW